MGNLPDCLRLDQRIFLKGCSVFVDLNIDAGIRHRNDLHVKISQNLADFDQLVFILCGKNNLLHL